MGMYIQNLYLRGIYVQLIGITVLYVNAIIEKPFLFWRQSDSDLLLPGGPPSSITWVAFHMQIDNEANNLVSFLIRTDLIRYSAYQL